MLIGLDLGFIQTKVKGDELKFKIPSLIGTPSIFELKQFKQSDNLLNDLIVSFDDKTYYVGKKATQTDNASICIRTDKTNSDQDRAELFAVLGYLHYQFNDKDYSIVTGLPVHDYNLSHTLKRNMEGNKVFTFGKGANAPLYELNVNNVVVIPQSAGAYFSYILDDNGKLIQNRIDVASGCTMVIDIGYKTTDVIVIENGKYQSNLSSTVEIGMKNIHLELIRQLRKKFDIKIDFTEAIDVCMNQSINVSGESKDISLLVEECAYPIARSIIDHINIYVSDIKKIDNILCCGGTMNLLYPHFKENYIKQGNNKVILLSDPEYSNAAGYYKYGKMLDANKSKIESK